MPGRLQPAEDDIVLDDLAFLRVMQSSRKVPQSRWRRVLCHEEPSGFQTWIGGYRLITLGRSLTVLRVLAHDAPMPARLIGRIPPRPANVATLLVALEVEGVPLTVEVPHTLRAATCPLPFDVTLAIGGPIAGPAQWYADPDEFAREQSRRGDGDIGSRAARAIVDLRLFEAGAGAAVSGIVEHAERVSSALVGDVMTLVVRTIVDIPVVVWCAPDTDPPPPGSVFDGTVAMSGFSRQLV